jgi:hypothetical protein
MHCLVDTTTTVAIHYKKERRPTCQQRSGVEKRDEHLDTEGHQGEGAGEKEETDWEEAEEPQMVDRCGLYNYRPRKLGEKSLLGE